jgi:hypothetical protein
MRRSGGVRRRPDHCDPAGRAQHPLDARIVENVDRSAALLEIEERRRAIAFLARQVAASRS